MLQKLRSFAIFPTQMEGAVEATLENVAVKKNMELINSFIAIMARPSDSSS
jgi:hypothetical protein